MKLNLTRYVRLGLIALALMFVNDLYGQRAKQLKNVSKSKVSKKRKKRAIESYSGGKILLLNGSKQIGARFVYFSNGFGGEADFGYLFNQRFVAEGGIGAMIENSGGGDLLRVPIHVGAKYRLLEQSVFLLYGGMALNFNIQSLKNISTDREISSLAFGPSFFGEAVTHINPTLGVVLRAEQVFLPTEKFQTSDGKEEGLMLMNLSLGIRKTF